MLRFLRIRNFALIRELEIEFGDGLNLLTGETGSGKSIIVDALSLLLGDRASPDVVRSGCDTAVLEGSFTLRDERISALLEEAGIESDDDWLLIRREIFANGRSRSFVNNCLATLTLLKAVGDTIADIHGQLERQSLLDLATHLEWLDRFGENAGLVDPVRESHRRLREIDLKLASMAMDEQERLRRVDILQFQVGEIRHANPQPDEKEELESERRILANREKIFSLSSEAYSLLHESEPSLLSQTSRLVRLLQELEGFDASWRVHSDGLREGLYKLEDLAYTVRDYTARTDFSPDRLNQVEQRLADLERLGKKYGHSIPEILAYATRCQDELEGLLSYADTSKLLAAQFDAEIKQYEALSERLCQKRRKDAVRLEREIRREFQALSMEKMELRVSFSSRADESKGSRIPSAYGPMGKDRVEFLIAPNKGEDFKPLAKIASGGELSRVMLAVKSLCGAGEAGKTLVFDEVDAGIGGRVAETVGRRLRDISGQNQVLCVTHLPQIAAFAHRHFSVRKEAVGPRTETSVDLLGEEERVQELARMLGGQVITETTRRHAREMLAHSLGTIKGQRKEA